MKKIQSCALLLALVLACLTGCQSGPEVWIKDVTAEAGETVSVEIYVSADSQIAATDLEVSFDASKLSYQSFTAGTAYQSGVSLAEETASGLVHMALVTLTPPEEEGVMATLTFTVEKGVTGSLPLALKYTSCCDYDGVEITPVCTGGTITVG